MHSEKSDEIALRKFRKSVLFLYFMSDNNALTVAQLMVVSQLLEVDIVEKVSADAK